MTTIILYGEMAEKFGAEWRLNVRSVGEAVRAIEANKPGLIAYLGESGDRGVDFNVKVDGVDETNEDALRCSRRIKTIEISPVVRGSKNALVNVIIGVVLIVVAIYAPYLLPALKGAAFGIEGGLTWAGMIGVMGVSLALSGVAQMIAGTPKIGNGASIEDGGKQNDLFNGPQNVVTQGGAVPLVLGGPILVGSVVASAGIYTEDTGSGGPFHNYWNPWDDPSNPDWPYGGVHYSP